MQKYSFTIDVTKIPKEKIIPRTYQNKTGVDVTVKEVEFEAVINKEELITSGDGWQLYKVGFVTFKGKKLENGEYSKEPIFGDVKEFRGTAQASSKPAVEGKGIDMSEFGAAVDESQIPF